MKNRINKLLKKVAKKNGISLKEVKREMDQVIEVLYQEAETNPKIKNNIDKIKKEKKGKISIEELIGYAKEELSYKYES